MENYKIIQFLGKGSFAETYKAKRLSDGKIITLKVIDMKNLNLPGSDETLELISHEISVLKRLKNVPNVSHYLDEYREGDKYFIEMDFIPGISLNDYFVKYKKYFNEKIKIKIAYIILKKMSKILMTVHQNGIVHSDITPSNIIVTPRGDLYLIDFGLSCKMKNKMCLSIGFTQYYMSPETYQTKINYGVTDVWSLGIIVYNIFQKYTLGDRFTPLNTHDHHLDDIVNHMLMLDHRYRLTAFEIYKLI